MAISKVVVVDGNNLIVRIDRGVAGRGVTDVEPIEIDGSLYLVFTFSDGTTETVGPVGTIQYIGQTPIVVTGSTISLSTVPVNLGGTGQTTANAGFNALAPTQTGNAGKYLKTDGTNSAWDLLDISTADITGVLPIANGGTNASTASGARTNLGLGTIATQDASAVAITGGSITGITDLAVADGGTGASTAAGAMVNLLPSYTGNANKRLGLDGTATGLEWVTDGGGTVTSVDVSGGTTGLSFTGGPVTTSGTITLSGTLDVDNGGTGATTAAGARTNLNAADQALTLTAGTGLSGGGDLSANRTFSITNTGVTAASYGSASNTLTATVNAQGQLTALAATPIAISNTQVSGLGTMSTQNSNAVTITGGSITGITDLAIADGGTGASNAADARSNLGLGTAAVLNAGVALGVATLDAGGTVPLSQIPASIQGGVSYQGAWNASTNTPTLTSSVGTKGHYYVVSVAGNTNLNGVTDWLVGDWAIYNGTAWEKIDNTDQVASVNGYTGVVVLTNTDVGAPPTSLTISAGTGLSGGGNLTTNRTLSIANTAVSAGSYGTASAVPSFTVNGQGQLTAASDVTIAITNTQVSGLGTMSTQNANSVSITGGSITGITDLAIADGGTGASTAGGALTNLGAIGTITSTDGSIVVTPSGTTVDLAVSAASPASTLLTQVRNTTGATLTKGTVVYISGATGQIATVSKAIATGDATSAQTLGMITSDLANNSNGYVTVFGLLENMDTSSYTDGAQLYLSGTTAGAVTATKPSAPTHLVYVAVVEYAHPTQGKLLVKVQNGYELDEIHDVSIVSPTTGQTLVYSASTDLWSNSNAPVISGTTINNTTIGETTASSGAFTTLSASSDVTLSGGTANGVLYLNGSKQATSGSALTFDGTTVGINTGIGNSTSLSITGDYTPNNVATFIGVQRLGGAVAGAWSYNDAQGAIQFGTTTNHSLVFLQNNAEAMRLTSTSLYTASGISVGIGTNNPSSILTVALDDSTGTLGPRVVGVTDPNKQLRLSYNTYDNYANIQAIQVGTSYTNLVLQQDGGNVGIGTNSPSYRLEAYYTDISGDRNSPNNVVAVTAASSYLPYNGYGAGLVFKSTNYVSGGIPQVAARIRNSLNDNSLDTYGSSLIFDVTATRGGSLVQAMELNYAGNLGLGTAPSAWASGYKVLEMQSGGNSIVAFGSSDIAITSGGYYNGGWKYGATNSLGAGAFELYSGTFVWYQKSAVAHNAGDPFTMTQAMTLDASGKLGIGNTNPSGFDNFANNLVVGTGSGAEGITIYGGSTDSSNISFADGTGAASYQGYIQYAHSTDSLGFYVNYSGSTNARMIIDSSGNVGIGTSSPNVKLDVNGSGRFRGFDSGYYNENVLAIGNASYDPKIGLASNGGYRWNTRIADVGASGAGYYVIRYEDGSLDTVTITRDGNLGLGVTPSAYSGLTTGRFEFGAIGNSVFSNGSNNAFYSQNTNYNGGYKYATTAAAGLYLQSSGSHIWYNAPSGTAGDAITFTQALTLDANGKLLLGTTVASINHKMKVTSSTEAGIILSGTNSVANDGSFTVDVANGTILMVSENNTGDGALFFCCYASATITLLSDPNNRYATSITAGRICVTKSAVSGTVTITNKVGSTKSITAGKFSTSD